MSKYIRYHRMRHPLDMGENEVREFLSWLALDKKVAASTQNQALNALILLYSKVLDKPLGDIGPTVRARQPPRLPVVLTRDEAMSIIAALKQPYRSMASLMYGAGLRAGGSTLLRVKDLDFRRRVITIPNGTGGKDRTTLMPEALLDPLTERMESIRKSLTGRPKHMIVPVTLPYALKHKYPGAPVSLAWQWLFPSESLCMDEDGTVLRHHIHTSSVQRAVKRAVRKLGMTEPIGCHTFRHSSATELLTRGCDIRTVPELLARIRHRFAGVRSPLSRVGIDST